MTSKQIELARKANATNLLRKLQAGKTLSPDELALLDSYDPSAKKKKQEIPNYASMTDCEARLRVPVEKIRYARANGCKAFDSGNRVNGQALMDFLFPLDKKIFSNGKKLAEILKTKEEFDSKTERARLIKQQREDLERKAKIESGELVNVEAAEEIIWHKLLSPLREELLALPKITGRQLRTLLKSANVADETIDKTVKILDTAIKSALVKIKA